MSGEETNTHYALIITPLKQFKPNNLRIHYNENKRQDQIKVNLKNGFKPAPLFDESDYTPKHDFDTILRLNGVEIGMEKTVSDQDIWFGNENIDEY